MTTFEPGAIISRCEVLHGQVWLETPVTVIADDGAQLAVLLLPGARFSFPPHPFGPHPWSSFDQWSGPTVLQLYREHDRYAVWMFFDHDQLRSWYVNFEAPLRRCDGAIETVDHGLDLIIELDGTTVWKDVEHLHAMRSTGRMTLAEIGEVLEAAAQVSSDLAADRRWWASWDPWRPGGHGDRSDASELR